MHWIQVAVNNIMIVALHVDGFDWAEHQSEFHVPPLIVNPSTIRLRDNY